MVNVAGDDERDEQAARSRNINALHAIPWDERTQIPLSGFGTRFFSVLSSPRFWEKMDWAFRGSILTVMPTMILSLEPTTMYIVPKGFASSLAFLAFWITMPTFGAGLRELYIVIKGFILGFILVIFHIAVHPGPAWLSILLLFIYTLVCSFLAEETKKTMAYVLASTIMQYVTDPVGTDYRYVGDYIICLLVSMGFAVAGFLVPFIRWSSNGAKHYIKAMGNALSIELQGTCSSFWVRTPLERELNVMRLRQLRATAEACIPKIETALDESDYEPHTGAYRANMRVRFAFCKYIHNILGSMSHIIELLATNPTLIETPMCMNFGAAIDDDLALITSAMDSMILKIVNFDRQVTRAEIAYFAQARDAFQDALSRVREEVILTNEDYETEEADVFLGFFMFSVDELCEVIAGFEEDPHPPNSLVHALLFPVRDIESVIGAFKQLFYGAYYNRTIPRRLKEAIKLALCMVVPTIFQVYAMGNSPTSAMAGASIIALCYNPTGSESFHYATGRLLGTVVGSICALMVVQIANLRRWVLYIFVVIIGFIGAYIQASPNFYALGNAVVCSMISIITQYQNQEAAITRINQNCFAILVYFAIITVLWPMRGRTKVSMGLDVSLRCLRESVARLLRNLDMPDDPSAIAADVSALLKEMHKKIRQQERFIPGAIEEPTMSSTAYPEEEWRRIVAAERKVLSALSMMRYAYHNFMSSRADKDTDLSVHWVVLHRIAPHACDLSDLIFAAVDLNLLSLGKATHVPTTHLTKLRAGMMEAHQAIRDTYISSIQLAIDGDDDDDNSEGRFMDNGYDYGNDGMGGAGSCYSFPGHMSAHDLPPHPYDADPASSFVTRGGDQKPPLGASTPTTPAAAAAAAAAIAATPGSPFGPPTIGNRSNKSATAAQPPPPQQQQKPPASPGAPAGSFGRGGGAAPTSFASAGRSFGRGGDAKDGTQTAAGGDEEGKKKKKRGYLSYNLSKEEEAALKNFVANRTFTGSMSMGGPGGQTAAAAAAAAVATGGAPQSAVGGTAQVFSVTGADDDLVSRLRKKHHMNKKGGGKKDDGDDSDGKKGGGDSDDDGDDGGAARRRTMDVDQLENLANSSFVKNTSFIRNTSIWGAFFKKKGHDGNRGGGGEEEDTDISEMSHTMQRPRPRKPRRHAHDDDGDGDDGEGEDDDDDSNDKTRRGKGGRRSSSLGRRKGPRCSHYTTPNASDVVSDPTADDDDDDDDDDDSHGSGATAAEFPRSGGPSSVPVDVNTSTATPAPTAPTTPAAAPPTAPTTGNKLPGAFSGPPPAATEGAATARPPPGERRGSGSGGSTENSDATVKKVLSSSGSTPEEKAGAKRLSAVEEHAGGKEKARQGASDSQDSDGSHPRSGGPGSSAPLLNSSSNNNNNSKPFPYDDDDGGGDCSSREPAEGTQILQNLSFFDAEKGEFVLTNHDIHSLEAFIFGTRALVIYINELQNAITDMQHASALARNL